MAAHLPLPLLTACCGTSSPVQGEGGGSNPCAEREATTHEKVIASEEGGRRGGVEKPGMEEGGREEGEALPRPPPPQTAQKNALFVAVEPVNHSKLNRTSLIQGRRSSDQIPRKEFGRAALDSFGLAVAKVAAKSDTAVPHFTVSRAPITLVQSVLPKAASLARLTRLSHHDLNFAFGRKMFSGPGYPGSGDGLGIPMNNGC
eukprot:3692223-Rhodomonas_salina.1